MLGIPFWELAYDMFDSFHHRLKSAFKRDVSLSFSLEGSEISADLNVKFLLVGVWLQTAGWMQSRNI